MRWGRALRIGLSVAAGLACLGAAALAAAWLYVGTDTGRRFVAHQIADALSGDGVTVAIGRLTGDVLGAFTLDDVTAADAAGRFARLDRARVDWRPLDLLHGALTVGRIAIDHADLDRLPSSGETSSAAAPLAIGLDVEIRRLTAKDIHFAKPVLGAPAHMRLQASAAVAADGDKARLVAKLTRTDGVAGKASVRLDYAAAPARFAAQADVEEPQGGQIARLLHLPGLPAVALHLKGDGPPTGWHGRLTAKAAPASVTAGLSVALQGRAVKIGARGVVRPGTLLPKAVRPIAGDTIAFDLAADIAPSQPIAITRVRINAARLSLAASGRYAPSTGTLTGEARLRATHPVVLDGGVAVAGGETDAKVSGTLARPYLAAQVTLDGLAAGGLGAKRAAGTVRLSPADGDRFHVAAEFKLSGLDIGSSVPPGLIGTEGTVTLDATGAPGAEIALSRLAVASGPLSLTLAGKVTPAGAMRGNYRLTLDRLKPLARTAGITLDGHLALAGGIRADAVRRSGEIELVGALDGVRGAAPKLATLIGARVPISGAVALRPGGKIEMIGLDVALAAGTLRGDATISMGAARETVARLAFAMPSLARLTPVAGIELAGRGSVQVTANGPLDALALRATARLDGLGVGNTAVGALGVGIGARLGPKRVFGTARLALIRDGSTTPGSFGFALTDKTLSLSDVAIGAGANRVTGALDVSRTDGLIRGALDGEIGALPALGLNATGAVKITARLDATRGQRIALTVDARTLRAEQAEVSSARVEATIDNAFGAPRIEGQVQLTDAHFGPAARRGPALSLSLTAHAARVDGGMRAEVTRLQGSFGGKSFRARAPILVDGGDRRWSGAADLSVAGGALTLKGEADPTRLELSATLDKLPLTVLALADPRLDLAGAASGKLDLSGPRAAPQGSASLSVEGIRARDADWPAGETFALAANAKLAGGRLALAARLRGPREARFDIEARTPVTLVLGPNRFEIAARGALDGSANLSGRLDLIDALVGLGENRVTGAVDGRIALGGTIAAPSFKGSLHLKDASYESITTGTVIRNIAASVEFDGAEARLAHLRGTDGAAGHMTGSGKVGFTPNGAWPIDLAVQFKDFAAVARSDATLHTTGEVQVAGTAQAPRLTGRLQIVRGDILIPDRLPQDVQPIQVVEINGPPRPAPAKPAEPGASLAEATAVPLHVAIAVPGRVFIRGRGLDSEWAGNLVIKGTSAAPRITGELHVVRGTFSFAGRTLKLSKGTVAFAGANPPDPDIDAQADLSLTGLTASILLSGKASAPKVALQSTPSMPQEEILSRMLFGKSASQISPVQAAQLAASAVELSGEVSPGGIVDRIRRTLGIDVLNVEQGNGGSPSIKAGKYIGENTFVTVQQGTQPGSQKVGVEIGLTKHLSVETDVGRDAAGSAGINWKWDY